MGGRGASSGGGGSSYTSGYLRNNPWLNNMGEETRKAMIENFENMPEEQQFYYSLTQDEQNALVQMQTNTQTINEYMSGRRTDISPEQSAQLDQEIANVKSAISHYDVKEPMTLYRGVNEAEFNNIASGGATESFKSTSVNSSTAENFARNQGGYIVEYHASRGARIANVNGAPGANEGEWLIDSNVKYRRVTRSGNRLIVEIRGIICLDIIFHSLAAEVQEAAAVAFL